jgi:multiple sugar transport system substrate-binding protein
MKRGKVLLLAAVLIFAASIVFARGGQNQSSSSGGAKKLTYWEMYWGPADQHEVATNKLVKNFNDSHQDIQVEVQYIPWNNYYQTFLTAITAQAAPDVATGATPNPIQFAVMGASLDLTPIMDQWKAENSPVLTDISEDLWKFFQMDGKQWGLPFGLDQKLFMYRTDYFQQAGITTMPRTWDDFTKVLQTLKQKFPDKIPLVQAAADNNSNHSMLVWMNSNQVGVTTPELKANFQSPAAIETLDYIKYLWDNELLSRGVAGYISADAIRIFQAGEACIVGYSSYGVVAGSSVEPLTRVMPPITGPSAAATGKSGAYFYCPNSIQGFNQRPANNDASRVFLKWWIENYGDYIIESGQGNYPARRSIMLRPEYQNNPILADIYKYVFSGEYPSNSMVFPMPSLYPAFANVEGEMLYGKVYRKVTSGVSSAQAAREGDAEIQRAIDEYNR